MLLVPSLQKSTVTWLTWSSDISDRDDLYGHKTRQRNQKNIYYTHLFTLLCLVILVFAFFLEKRDLFPAICRVPVFPSALYFFFLLCSLVPIAKFTLFSCSPKTPGRPSEKKETIYRNANWTNRVVITGLLRQKCLLSFKITKKLNSLHKKAVLR